MRGNVWAQFSKSALCGVTEGVGTSVIPPARHSVIFHFQKVVFFYVVLLLLLLLFCQLEAYTKKDTFFRRLKATDCSIERRRKENNISILPLTPTAGKLYKLHLHGQKKQHKGWKRWTGRRTLGFYLDAIGLRGHGAASGQLQSLTTSTSRRYITHSSPLLLSISCLRSSSFTSDQRG